MLFVAAAAAVFLGSIWFTSSTTQTVALGPTDTVLIVNSAGPVRVRSIDAFDGSDLGIAVTPGDAVVQIDQSWLMSRPQIESLSDGGSSVVRVSCPGRFPCRASLEVFVSEGSELSVVAAQDVVQVDRFRGELSIFAGDGGVALGAVAGSVNVVTTGPVEGATLGPAALTVNVVDQAVDLVYLDPPTLVAVQGEAAPVDVRLPSSEGYDIGVEAADVEVLLDADPSSERRIAVVTGGSARIGPTEQAEQAEESDNGDG